MARKQKKKPTEKKKNRSDGASGSSSAQTEQSVAVGTAAEASAGTEVRRKKQKPSYSGSGRAGSKQTFVVKLADRYFGNWIQFLREVKVELARVTWPGRKETIGTTAIVLVFVFISAGYLGIVDLVLSSLMRLVL